MATREFRVLGGVQVREQPAYQVRVWPVFSKGLPCCGQGFTCHAGSGPPIPTPLGPTFQPVDLSIWTRGVLCPLTLPRFVALLLAEGRDDSRHSVAG